MKRFAIAVILLAFCAPAAFTQTCSGRGCKGNVTATNSSCITTACVALNLPTNTGSAALTISGTFVGTLQFEAAGDGVNFAALNCYPSNSTTAASSATAAGTWQCSVAGYSNIRIRASAYTSGTAAVSINSSAASTLYSRQGGAAALAFYPQDVLISANGSVSGTTVTTANLANASTTEIAANYTGISAAATGMTYSASCVTLPASVSIRGGSTRAAGFAGQSLALVGTNTFTTSQVDFSGIPVQKIVVISGFICNLPPANAGSGTFYDLAMAVGTITPITGAFQLNDGNSGPCGAYGIEIEKSGGTTTHSTCNTLVAPGSSIYFSMIQNWSATGTCGAQAAPCAAVNIYQTDAKTQIGSTITIPLGVSTDQFGGFWFGNNEGASTAQTYKFQWLMIDYTNHVWPNIAH